MPSEVADPGTDPGGEVYGECTNCEYPVEWGAQSCPNPYCQTEVHGLGWEAMNLVVGAMLTLSIIGAPLGLLMLSAAVGNASLRERGHICDPASRTVVVRD